MIVEKFGSGDIKEVEVPDDYQGCRYCYVASKTCHFYREGDCHFLRIEGELREVACMTKGGGSLALSCHPITEQEARRLISRYHSYN